MWWLIFCPYNYLVTLPTCLHIRIMPMAATTVRVRYNAWKAECWWCEITIASPGHILYYILRRIPQKKGTDVRIEFPTHTNMKFCTESCGLITDFWTEIGTKVVIGRNINDILVNLSCQESLNWMRSSKTNLDIICDARWFFNWRTIILQLPYQPWCFK